MLSGVELGSDYKDPLMRLKYNKLKAMKGVSGPLLLIARKLIIRIRRILLNNEPYVVGVASDDTKDLTLTIWIDR